MSIEIDFILKDLRTNLKDLQTLYSHDKTDMDIECYRDIKDILNNAESKLIDVMALNHVRKLRRKKKYEQNSRSTIPRSL